MNDVNFKVLAEDVIYLILLNLPVKSLLRFRSVSKSWNDIITSRAFAKLHCRNARSHPRTYHLFKQCLSYNDDDEETLHYYATLNDHVSSACCGGGRLPPTPLKLQLPLKLNESGDPARKGGFLFDSSSWDGMICTPTYEPDDNTAAILVWNPFTHQIRWVSWPVAYTEFQTVLYSFVGFGYDHTADDYKIVVHTHDFSISDSRTFVMALRSSNSAWRSIDGLSEPWGRRHSKAVTLDNGDVYWIISWSSSALSGNINKKYYWVTRVNNLEGRSLIVKFSFTDEQLTILPSPPKKHSVDEFMWTCQLGQYEGSLCFFNYLIRAHRIHRIHIWTLAARDHNGGKKGTWVDVMHVPLAPLGYERLIPLGFTISGDLLIGISDHDDRDLMIYLAGEDRFVVVRLMDDAELGSERATFYHLLHTESLISPK